MNLRVASGKHFSTVMLILFLTLMPLSGGCSQEEDSSMEDAKEEAQNGNNEQEKEGSSQEEPETTEPEEPVQPIGVIIDNLDRARPQSGLQQATCIYEFLVESGISRFLAVYDKPFQEQEDFDIGPVRSLRPYMAEKSLEYGGIIAHGGYSSRTGEQIRGMELQHLHTKNELWRDSSRSSPHNLYTSMDQLREVVGYEEAPRETGTPLDEIALDHEKGKEVDIKYDEDNQVTYIYDKEQEHYRRYVNQQPHRDTSEEQYYADRVILQRTPHHDVIGTPLISIELDGKGEGVLYEEGRQYPLTWKRENHATLYYFEDGSQVNIDGGTTWIQIVPQQ